MGRSHSGSPAGRKSDRKASRSRSQSRSPAKRKKSPAKGNKSSSPMNNEKARAASKSRSQSAKKSRSPNKSQSRSPGRKSRKKSQSRSPGRKSQKKSQSRSPARKSRKKSQSRSPGRRSRKKSHSRSPGRRSQSKSRRKSHSRSPARRSRKKSRPRRRDSRSISKRKRSESTKSKSRRRRRRRSRSISISSSSSDGEPPPVERVSDYGVDTMNISDADAAFILSKNGRTKQKIINASGGAEIDVDERDLVIEIRGSAKQRKLGMKYAKFVMGQRNSSVHLSKEKHDDGDLTLLTIPEDAVGFVTGRGGNFLRSLEEEWSVLMLFVQLEEEKHKDRSKEHLAIFGERRGRRGTELKALSAVEAKCPGFFEQIRDEVLYRETDDDWGASTITFKDKELAYALGKGGSTRKKIERSSGCITQYLGETAVFAGTREERSRAKEYTTWLFDQLDGPVHVKDYETRTDCSVVSIPQDCVGYVTGTKRSALGKMEEEFGVLMFFMGSKNDMNQHEKLIVFGSEAGRAGAVLKVKATVETKARGHFTKNMKQYKSSSKGFDTDVIYLEDAEISYALGARGTTRIKLQRASGCCMQYVSNYAHFAGTRKQRKRGKEYLKFLLDQRSGSIMFDTFSKRKDMLSVTVPRNLITYVKGNKAVELRRREEETGTFCFIAEDRSSSSTGDRIVILGHEEGTNKSDTGRRPAQKLIEKLLDRKERDERRRRSPSRRRRRRSQSRRRSDSRRRSPSRRRRRSRSRRRSPSGRRSRSRRRSPSGRHSRSRRRSPSGRRSRSRRRSPSGRRSRSRRRSPSRRRSTSKHRDSPSRRRDSRSRSGRR